MNHRLSVNSFTSRRSWIAREMILFLISLSSEILKHRVCNVAITDRIDHSTSNTKRNPRTKQPRFNVAACHVIIFHVGHADIWSSVIPARIFANVAKVGLRACSSLLKPRPRSVWRSLINEASSDFAIGFYRRDYGVERVSLAKCCTLSRRAW